MSETAQLLEEVADLRRRLALASRHGAVTDVKDGKVRMSMGFRADGEMLKGPWTYPGQHNGIMRQDIPFRVGQNVTMEMPTGDPSQARILPYGPNEDNPRPVHAREDAATSQFPHFDKDGKEIKDADKPGFQRTENAEARTTAFDKISTSTQTAKAQTREILDKVGGKARSLIEQTFGALNRTLDDGAGLVSLMKHSAAEVLHKVGDQATHSHTAEGFLRQVGQSKLQHLADKVLHQVGGGASSLLDAGKHLFAFGGHTAETTSGGLKMLGGLISHNGRNIGGDHTHFVMTKFGGLLTMIPIAIPGGGGGGEDTPQPPVPQDGTQAFNDALPFAWGGFDRAADGTVTLRGSQYGVTFAARTDGSGNVRATFTVEPPHGGATFRVMFGEDGPLTLRILSKTNGGFTISPPTADTAFTAWFIIMP